MPRKSKEAASTTVYLTGIPLALLRSEMDVAQAAHGVRPSGSAMAALILEAVAARQNARDAARAKKGAKS